MPLAACDLVSARARRGPMLGDAKMQEMLHFLGSHAHDERLMAAANCKRAFRGPAPPTFREAAEIIREVEAAEDNQYFSTGTENIESRLLWRDQMDRNMKRLLLNAELAPNERLRCSHVNGTYDWYRQHGRKQARKEREAPPYLHFDAAGSPMAGSLREKKPKAAALERPQSLPDLRLSAKDAAPQGRLLSKQTGSRRSKHRHSCHALSSPLSTAGRLQAAWEQTPPGKPSPQRWRDWC